MCAWPTATFLRSRRRVRVVFFFLVTASTPSPLLALLLAAGHGSLGAAPGAPVGSRALAPRGQAAAVAHAAVGADLLQLLVLRVRAQDAHDALALDHLAARAHLLDRRTNLHLLLISRIRPRERSLSESSTPTRLPATSRTKWVPRRSATWARTLTPFS